MVRVGTGWGRRSSAVLLRPEREPPRLLDVHPRRPRVPSDYQEEAVRVPRRVGPFPPRPVARVELRDVPSFSEETSQTHPGPHTSTRTLSSQSHWCGKDVPSSESLFGSEGDVSTLLTSPLSFWSCAGRVCPQTRRMEHLDPILEAL